MDLDSQGDGARFIVLILLEYIYYTSNSLQNDEGLCLGPGRGPSILMLAEALFVEAP